MSDKKLLSKMARELEIAHRYHMGCIYGGNIAFEHREGLKKGCIVCDMIRPFSDITTEGNETS